MASFEGYYKIEIQTSKMNKTLYALLLVFLISCTSKAPQERLETQEAQEAILKVDSVLSLDQLLQDSSIQKLVIANHQKIANTKGNFNSYKIYLNDLSNDNLTSIPFALDYINTCLATDNKNRDSIFFLFNLKYWEVVNAMNDLLFSTNNSVTPVLNQYSHSTELNSINSNLAACGLKVESSEGTFYFDAMPDYLYNNFKDRVSPGVLEFLSINQDELTHRFSEDAQMLISFDDLYKRVITWENYINKHPKSIYIEQAKDHYKSYLSILLTGMDNTPVFDYTNKQLLPEVKTLYERIMKERSGSRTTKTISLYYSLLSRHAFKENDSIQTFMQAQGVSLIPINE